MVLQCAAHSMCVLSGYSSATKLMIIVIQLKTFCALRVRLCPQIEFRTQSVLYPFNDNLAVCSLYTCVSGVEAW